jgi:hypothetical protein
MDNNKITRPFHAVFGVFMVVFYLGAGIYLLFFGKQFYIDSAIRGILGTTFLLYGAYRSYTTYRMIVRAFFSKDEDED